MNNDKSYLYEVLVDMGHIHTFSFTSIVANLFADENNNDYDYHYHCHCQYDIYNMKHGRDVYIYRTNNRCAMIFMIKTFVRPKQQIKNAQRHIIHSKPCIQNIHIHYIRFVARFAVIICVVWLFVQIIWSPSPSHIITLNMYLYMRIVVNPI